MTKSSRSHFSSPRTAPRIPTVSGIVLNYEGQSDLTFVRSPDVSVRGMFVNTTRHFPEGAILNVRFRLALSGASLQARGEVRYCLPGVGIGLEFIDLHPATRKLIEHEVALNHPIPARPQNPSPTRSRGARAAARNSARNSAAKSKRRPKSRRRM